MARILVCDRCKVIRPKDEFKKVGDKDYCSACFSPIEKWMNYEACFITKKEYEEFQCLRKEKYLNYDNN